MWLFCGSLFLAWAVLSLPVAVVVGRVLQGHEPQVSADDRVTVTPGDGNVAGDDWVWAA